jgi:hypothetical protein
LWLYGTCYDRIANLVFSDYVNYWSDKYFKELESLEEKYASSTQSEAMKWRVSSDELKKNFPLTKIPETTCD